MFYEKRGSQWLLRLEVGEEVVASLQNFMKATGVKAAQISAIGACDRMTIGCYDVKKKHYLKKEFQGEFEILSLLGNLSTQNNEPYVHLHILTGDDEFQVRGGHLNEAWISATCEMNIREIDGEVDRFYDEETGLNLWKI
jgi:predicted DNA-binding protein with PD1-like motif